MSIMQTLSAPDPLKQAAASRFKAFSDSSVIERIWQKDYTLWRPVPDEITNRLGWLDIASRMRSEIVKITDAVSALRDEGFTHAVLLGMGGSSLAPDVFRETFGQMEGYLSLTVLDSTDPGAVLSIARTLDPEKTVYIVSTKSGGTVETLSFFKYYYNLVASKVTRENAGKHFIAITDPGSKLEKLAEQYQFRETFLNDPNIGGRYSALSFFGLVPAAMMGVNLQTLLKRALAAEEACSASIHPIEENMGAALGVLMGEAALMGRDKVTFILPQTIARFGDWVEQLIAESTGKENKGIIPIAGEKIGPPSVYGDDRLFIQVSMEKNNPDEPAVDALASAGHPIIRLRIVDPYDLGILMVLFEFATAVAGIIMDIHPFDQPDVEAAKVLAQKAVAAYQSEGRLPSEKAQATDGGIIVLEPATGKTVSEAVTTFLDSIKSGDYVGLHAYVMPSDAVDRALDSFRLAVRKRTRAATTVGYGPRFLHSTGQLHKGDDGSGVFIRLTADMPEDAAIPDQAGEDRSTMSFGILKTAQALGDTEALTARNRRVLRIHLSKAIAAEIDRLTAMITNQK